MTIVYALVSREKTVLSEYSATTGNWEEAVFDIWYLISAAPYSCLTSLWCQEAAFGQRVICSDFCVGKALSSSLALCKSQFFLSLTLPYLGSLSDGQFPNCYSSFAVKNSHWRWTPDLCIRSISLPLCRGEWNLLPLYVRWSQQT